MKDHVWNIGVFGTFDVENYGDLLFPFIAEAELSKRLGNVKVRAFSYHAKASPDWPYPVTSLSELPKIAGSLDGVLIGGGLLIRFDKGVAPAYGPPTSAIHHPTGYWLTPALIAFQQGIPVIWNAPGMHGNEVPTWAEPLMELTFALSSYISVRDEHSRSALTRLAGGTRINVVPDTAFGMSQLLDGQRLTAEFTRLREKSGLTGPYIVVQATRGIEPYLRFIKRNSRLFRDFRLLALPTGPALGDDAAILNDHLPNPVCLSEWPSPLLLAEIISQASGVMGHSYHLMITALAFGVPVFSFGDLSVGKHAGLSKFKTINPLRRDGETDPHWFLTRLGKTDPSPEALATLDQLSEHWDRVAAALRSGFAATQPTLNRFWESLPGLLERSGEFSRADLQSRDDLIARLYDSPSWKVTAPARFLLRNLKRLLGNNGSR